MRRFHFIDVVIGILIAAFVAAALLGINSRLDSDRTFNPPTAPSSLNGLSDGRYHTCGFITEEGVTQYLSVYTERCGVQTP